MSELTDLFDGPIVMLNENCFEAAIELAGHLPQLLVCHGRPIFHGDDQPESDGRFWHAWCETDSGSTVLDFSHGKEIIIGASSYYLIGKIENVTRYTREEALIQALRSEHWGPWDG